MAVPSVAFAHASAVVVVAADGDVDGDDRSTLSQLRQEQHRAGIGTLAGQASGARAFLRLEQPGQRTTIGKKSSGGGEGIIFFLFLLEKKKEWIFLFFDKEKK